MSAGVILVVAHELGDLVGPQPPQIQAMDIRKEIDGANVVQRDS